jgi:hypothetical protein
MVARSVSVGAGWDKDAAQAFGSDYGSKIVLSSMAEVADFVQTCDAATENVCSDIAAAAASSINRWRPGRIDSLGRGGLRRGAAML